MRQQVILSPIGTDQPALGLPGIGQIRGVLIDNPSGSWLFLRPSNDFIPPYTLGFARSFQGGIAALTIEFVDGPGGLLSTREGSPPVVILDSEPVGNSPGRDSGATFISARHQPEVVPVGPAGLNAGLNTFTTSLLGGDPNKRLRVYYYWARQSSPTVRTQVILTITDSGGTITLPPLVVNINRTSDRVVFPDPFNMPLGQELEFLASFSALGNCEVGAMVGIV